MIYDKLIEQIKNDADEIVKKCRQQKARILNPHVLNDTELDGYCRCCGVIEEADKTISHDINCVLDKQTKK